MRAGLAGPCGATDTTFFFEFFTGFFDDFFIPFVLHRITVRANAQGWGLGFDYAFVRVLYHIEQPVATCTRDVHAYPILGLR